tara:strand:- start:333 stop:476 length:144 start_codon:yes stop_codon:yes gene_type:complete
MLVPIVAIFALVEIVGVAYDANVVNAPTITVPPVTALGVGVNKPRQD